jgi:hypothetical protein
MSAQHLSTVASGCRPSARMRSRASVYKVVYLSSQELLRFIEHEARHEDFTSVHLLIL